ncbi:MAG: hypothetical protein JWM85_1327 [Acidimicrobiaceae bacterium]|nr:hypothetical protein [Acidimicrobiaceae bacterium]
MWYSLGSALTNPTFGVSVSGRFAEWARDHGGGGIVVWAENTWYSHHPPKVGGAPSAASLNAKGADKSSGTTHVAKSTVLPAPKAIQPFAAPALRGEGTWAPVGRLVHGVPAVYEAFLRPDAVHTSYVAGVAWMDTKLLKASLYSGSYIPGGGPWPLTAPVQPGAARSLVAAFNAGFRTQDSQGGYYTDHQTVAPLRAGSASFVIYKNGSATVGQWGRDVRMTPQVASVRQNLVLLVDGGKPAPTLNANDTTKWGLTLGNQVYVWRSGVGVTANGALVYVAGPALNITDLANLLARAGAVRAMELDINTDWVNFATFKPAGNGLASTANGTDLLSNMSASPARYFDSAWSRDFFTMSARGG